MSLDNYHPGCMQSLLHFLDLHQRLYKRKTLGYRRHDSGSRSGSKSFFFFPRLNSLSISLFFIIHHTNRLSSSFRILITMSRGNNARCLGL